MWVGHSCPTLGSTHWIDKRQCGISHLRLASYIFLARQHKFLASISQCDRAFAVTGRQNCNACQFCDVFALVLNSETRQRSRSLDLESSKRSMHRTPRANSLNDFLPDVAPLVEIQGPVLSGLLGQVPFANVLTELRNSTRHAKCLERVLMKLKRACAEQSM